MKNNLNWALTGICIIITAAILGSAYKYKYHAQDTIVVTGLGEKEFTSDLIVWRGWIVQQSPSAEAGYAQLESAKRKVQEFIRSKGIADSSVVFQFVNVNRTTEPIYANGQYIGQRNTGYELRQEFTVEPPRTPTCGPGRSPKRRAAGSKNCARPAWAFSRSRAPIRTRRSRPEERSIPPAKTRSPGSPCGWNTTSNRTVTGKHGMAVQRADGCAAFFIPESLFLSFRPAAG